MKFNYGNVKQSKPRKKGSVTYGDSTGFDQEAEFSVGVSTRQSHVFNMFLDNTISSPQDFKGFVQCFNLATPDDEVNIYLSSPGGSIDGGMAFIQAEQACRAPVTYFASGCVASMAAIILCNADQFAIHPHTSVLLHSASFGTGGPAIDTERYSTFMRAQCERFMSFYVAGILSRAELKEIYENKREMWLTASEFCERFERKQACRDALELMFEEEDIPPDSITPEDYTELLLDMVEDFEEAKKQEALKASKPKRKPKAKVVKTPCCGSEGCSC